MLIGISYLAGVNNLLKDTSYQQKVTELNSIGYTVQDEVILATSMSDGYVRNFTVPKLAGRFTYAISSDSTSITLVSDDIKIIYDIPDFSGSIVKGNNIISKNGVLKIN